MTRSGTAYHSQPSTPGGRGRNEAQAPSPQTPVVFFDGECGLCNGFAAWVLRRDRGRLRYAPLQGETAARALSPELCGSLSTVVLLAQGRITLRTEALCGILEQLSAPWPLVGKMLAAVPSWLRDAGYRAVAAGRRGWPGKPTACARLPPSLKARVLP